MPTYVLGLAEIDSTRFSEVGGKAAGLGELARLPGVRVPDGFCVSTEAYRQALACSPALAALIDRLTSLPADDSPELRALGAEIRRQLEAATLPPGLVEAVSGALARLGAALPCAVRSSATAEDLPEASFAGQHDSFLHLIGEAAVLEHIRRCWASLFTDRAVLYRARAGLSHRGVHMAVVVQRLILPQVAGTLFTADPVHGDRRVCTIEASFGLAEALVAGQVNPDRYRLRAGQIIEAHPGDKAPTPRAHPGGDTAAQAAQPQPALTDAQLLELEALGRRIEAHFGQPQDIEWCLQDEALYVVQSRPITTLFPIPNAGDSGNHVFLSVGHQQVMTDAMRPLGLAMFQRTAGRPMFEAGGRLFVDPTLQLASPLSRDLLLDTIGRGDPLTRDALDTLLAREGFFPSLPPPPPGPPRAPPPPAQPDAALIPTLIARSEDALAALRRRLEGVTGAELLDLILEDVGELKRSLTEPQNVVAIIASINAANWLNDKLAEWLDDPDATHALSQSAPHNVTSEMGLALLDLADAIRPWPQVVAYLSEARDADFWEGLEAREGGPAVRAALSAWLERYGMRCPGEIDLTRPRWSERPTTLVPLLLSDLRTTEPGAAARRLEAGRRVAAEREASVLARLRELPDGEQKAAETQRMIRQLRDFYGYREHPKYTIICRFFVYKQALLAEAERLLDAGLIDARDDIDFLTPEELRELTRARAPDPALIRRRREKHARDRRLTPPRVITSDGEVLAGAYRRTGLPAGALVGLGVSAGVVEGRARVVRALAEARLEPGDILVTPFTDPSWTPLFVAVAGLVTEVGGLMTHGSVIAREYGLPAVVSVEDATRRIRDGQRVRVHGTEGYVELLSK